MCKLKLPYKRLSISQSVNPTIPTNGPVVRGWGFEGYPFSKTKRGGLGVRWPPPALGGSKAPFGRQGPPAIEGEGPAPPGFPPRARLPVRGIALAWGPLPCIARQCNPPQASAL